MFALGYDWMYVMRARSVFLPIILNESLTSLCVTR